MAQEQRFLPAPVIPLIVAMFFFFEKFKTPLRVNIKIPVNVATFGGISLVASSLNVVESQRNDSGLFAGSSDFPKHRGYKLISFEVSSPPNVAVLADPSWLAVFIGLLALGVNCIQLLGSYSSVKREARELASDLGSLKHSIQQQLDIILSDLTNLTQTQKDDLRIGANLYLDDAKRSAGELEALLLRATRFASTLGSKSARPSLDVHSERNKL